MTNEQAKSELMQIYMSLSEEKKQALDVLMAQADGEYISKDTVIEWLKEKDIIKTVGQEKEARKQLNELPSIDIPPDHDACENCKYLSIHPNEEPCRMCMHNYTDKWKMKKPTDTITMTREEFSEKLMEHYRQGRADEKAYQNGEIMQSFNPD